MNLRSLRMLAAVAALLAAYTLPIPGASPKPTAAMMKPIQAATDAINSGNASALASGIYASNATVVDEFSPFVWSGANAGVSWVTDFGKFAKQVKIANAKGVLTPIKTFDQSGNRAYIVVPTNFAGTMNGKPFKETGAWTFTLERSGNSWMIVTQTWGTTSMSM